MRINPNTGMPFTPEGFEWRITTTVYNEGFRVDLVPEHSTGISSYSPDSAYIHWGWVGDFKPQHRVTHRDLRVAAAKILRARRKRLKNEDRGAQSLERLVGTYPPKKLGGI